MKMMARVNVVVDVPFDHNIPVLEVNEDRSDNSAEVDKARKSAAKHADTEILKKVKADAAALGTVVSATIGEVFEA